MRELDRDALDRHITGGDYYREELRVTCSCGETTTVTCETEYGGSTLTPGECASCGNPWPPDFDSEPDGPDEDAIYDRWREDRDEMGER